MATKKCTTCSGSGLIPDWSLKTSGLRCPTCGGTGVNYYNAGSTNTKDSSRNDPLGLFVILCAGFVGYLIWNETGGEPLWLSVVAALLTTFIVSWLLSTFQWLASLIRILIAFVLLIFIIFIVVAIAGGVQ